MYINIHAHSKFMTAKYLLIFLIPMLFAISFTSASIYSSCDIYGNCKPVATGTTAAAVNYSVVNVNNSLYWQGHTGTDGSWLTGISMSNTSYVPYTGATQNVNLGIYNLTTLGIITANDFFRYTPSYVMTGTLTPDATGNYSYGGIYQSYAYYVRDDANYYVAMSVAFPGVYSITTSLGGSPMWLKGSSQNNPFGDYNGFAGGSGTGTFTGSSSTSELAGIGNCPVGQVVQNTTASGVQCIAVGGMYNVTYDAKADYNFTQNFNGTGDITTTGNATFNNLNLNGKLNMSNNSWIIDSSGYAVINQNLGYLYKSQGASFTIDWRNLLALSDNDAKVSLRWGERQLYDSAGTTIMMNWATNGTVDFINNNITAKNICYSNGTNCQASSGGMNYTNLALTNQTNTFTTNQYFEGNITNSVNTTRGMYICRSGTIIIGNLSLASTEC